MHVGGIHFLASILILSLCICITVVLLYGMYLLLSILRNTICRSLVVLQRAKNYIVENNWILSNGKTTKNFIYIPALNMLNKPVFCGFFLVCSALITLDYVYERFHWMGDDNAYYKAKEYWVAGQVCNSQRMIIGQLLHPENPLNYPYILLQKVSYSLGSKYLPEDDGERHVWVNQWFLYHYVRKFDRPYSVTSHKYEPEMVLLLDQCWASLRGMAVKSYKDSQMRRRYELGFPLLASYYSLFNGHYKGALFNSGYLIRKDPILITRQYDILQWLDDLVALWERDGFIEQLKVRYPFVLAKEQEVSMYILRNLAVSLIGNDEFSCNHLIMNRLYAEYYDAMSTDPSKKFFLLYKKDNNVQAKWLYKSAVYGCLGSSSNYFFEEICGRKMPQEKYVVITRKDPFCYFDSVSNVKFTFRRDFSTLP